MSDECEHGDLRRQCDRCEMQARIAELERELAGARMDFGLMAIARDANANLLTSCESALEKAQERAERAERERDEARAIAGSWVKANGPGGWVDDNRRALHDLRAERDTLRKQVERLRAAVAVEVMGWGVIEPGLVWFDGERSRGSDWRPDTDANDRDAVVEAMIADGWEMTLEIGRGWCSAQFGRDDVEDDDIGAIMLGDDVGRAVCEAAMRAKRAALAAVRGGDDA